MRIIYFMLPISLGLGFGFLFAFVRSALRGQYDDLETPAHRILLEKE
jgi:cbb3-type cytochrome oxidase maturation protein